MGLNKDNTFGVKECKVCNGTNTREIFIGDNDLQLLKKQNLPHSVQISQKMFCDPLSFQT